MFLNSIYKMELREKTAQCGREEKQSKDGKVRENKKEQKEIG